MAATELEDSTLPHPISLRERVRHFSIRVRVILLAATMLIGVVITNCVLLTVIASNAAVVKREAELFADYVAASEAVRVFGEMKYWLTDLAVSQLVNSERNASDAARRFGEDLTTLRPIDPKTVDAIKGEIDGLVKDAGNASDAYAAGKRIIGNALMAKARDRFSAIDARLASLATAVATKSHQTREAMAQSAERSLVLLLVIFIAVLTAGVFATIGMLRTIARPLKVMHAAVLGLTAGNLDVAIPTDAPDEVAAVGRALELFRKSISERNRLAEAESKQRQTLSDAIETIGEGFALFDANEILLVSNTQLREIFPRSAHVFHVGASYREVLRSIAEDSGAVDDPARTDDWIEQQYVLRRTEAAVHEIAYDNGSWVRINERRSVNGETVAVFLDVTDQKRREAELAAARDLAETANVSKSQFIANMSHELRTPLNAIIGYSEMLKEETEGLVDAEVLKDLDKIRNAGKHLLALINDVLDLSKIEAGKMQLDFDFIDLGALIEEVAATIKPLADHNGNRFEIKQPDSLVPLWADGMRLKQCLLNLLSNACKFTKAGTVTLDVHCERRGDGEVMMFDVRDTGIGIPPNKLDRLFQQFSQVDASTTRKFGGTGLGLATSRHFCRMMGGDITVTSVIDTGSIFSIALPIRGPGLANQMLAPAFDGTAMAANDLALPAPGGTVLVIDDSENDRTLLRRYLEREGFDVITASSGVEGLALLRKHRPAAVTLDIKMDYIDGWTVLAAIRGDVELSAIPVIMVSILSEAERSRTMGAAGFVTKPIDRDQLVPLLEHFTGGGIVRRALVVDDDEASRTMLRRTLEARGWEVQEAENGRQALAAVAQACPDLIMLDLMMPEADGFEVVEALRANTATANIPVLIVTAKELTDAERRRLSADVVGVLQKGIYTHADISRVMSAVKHALAARGGVETGFSNVASSEELSHLDADADERI